jgi:hypothetical protein
VALCTDRAVFFAAFHHAKAEEEKKVDPLEVCACVCVCVRAYVSLCEHGLSQARSDVSYGLLIDKPCTCEHMEA